MGTGAQSAGAGGGGGEAGKNWGRARQARRLVQGGPAGNCSFPGTWSVVYRWGDGKRDFGEPTDSSCYCGGHSQRKAMVDLLKQGARASGPCCLGVRTG